MPNKEYPKKILLVSDSISSHSGLGRITRDLAQRIHADMSDEFTVATAGYGGPGSSKFPWPDYHFSSVDNWLLPELPQIAHDFAGDKELIVMFVWDFSRLGWFTHPDWCPVPALQKWLKTAKIKKWGYGAIDAEGPNGKLSLKLDHIYKGFDRVLNYSEFSAKVTGYPDHLPHGIDTSVFKPYDRKKCKKEFKEAGFPDLKTDSFLVGIVATNQNRKDWALGFQTAKAILDRGEDVKLWCHPDVIERHWDIGAMVSDFGLQGRVALTTSQIADEQMAKFYSACDVTLGIGNGEGFGYPIFESLACGTPVIHGAYAGAAEWLPYIMQVEPIAWRYEGPYCCKRAVHDPQKWADAVIEWQGQAYDYSILPAELDWTNAWQNWKNWLRRPFVR